jgi:hypothetical protein
MSNTKLVFSAIIVLSYSFVLVFAPDSAHPDVYNANIQLDFFSDPSCTTTSTAATFSGVYYDLGSDGFSCSFDANNCVDLADSNVASVALSKSSLGPLNNFLLNAYHKSGCIESIGIYRTLNNDPCLTPLKLSAEAGVELSFPSIKVECVRQAGANATAKQPVATPRDYSSSISSMAALNVLCTIVLLCSTVCLFLLS